MRTLIVLVAIIASVFAQPCPTCSNPLFSLPDFIDVCQTGGLYRYGVMDFNLMALGYTPVSGPVVAGNVQSMTGGDVEGRVFANGNLLLLGNAGYSIGDKIVNYPSNAKYIQKAYSAVVGGNVMWSNGQLNPVNNDSNHRREDGVYFGASSTAPDWLRFSQCNSGNPLDITDFRDAAQTLSTQLHAQVATGTYSTQNNGQTLVLNGAAGVCNLLFRISAEDWNNHKDFMLVGFSVNTNVIVDIDCDGNPIVFMEGEFPAMAENILYNFGPECEGVEIVAKSLTGSILAPWSTLDQTDGRIWGNVVVGEVSQFLQINEIPCPGNPQSCDCCNQCFAGSGKKGCQKGDILLGHNMK